MGVTIPIFEVNAAYVGEAAYELSMIAGFDMDDVCFYWSSNGSTFGLLCLIISSLLYQVINLFNKLQDVASNLVDQFNSAIDFLQELVGAATNGGFARLFDGLKEVIEKLPETFDSLTVWVDKAIVIAESNRTFVDSSFQKFFDVVGGMILEIRDDIEGMYYTVYDLVTDEIPSIGKAIGDAIVTIFEALKVIPDCPVAAIWAILSSVTSLQESVARILIAKDTFLTAFFLNEGAVLPSWLDPTDEFEILIEEG